MNVRGRLIGFDQPRVMGILNVTPDSFYADSRAQTDDEIAQRARRLMAEGADIIDIGACSTRPGSAPVGQDEEMKRLRSALGIVRRELPEAIISVDTFRSDVARMCVEELGADMINDVGAPADVNPPHPMSRQHARQMASLGVPYVLMSSASCLRDMLLGFAADVQLLRDMGARDIIVDPGFGFGKTLAQNYQLMGELEKLRVLQLPLLVGISRKSMIYRLFDSTPDEALNGTTVLNTIALTKGASILRVHDVKEAVECCKITSQFSPLTSHP